MVALLRSIAHSNSFTNFITAVILFAGILVGVETYPSIVEQHGGRIIVDSEPGKGTRMIVELVADVRV